MANVPILVLECVDALPNEPSTYTGSDATLTIGADTYNVRIRAGMSWQKEEFELPTELHASIHATNVAEGPP